MPETGIYPEGVAYLDTYWEQKNRHPFLVYCNDELSGFVLVNQVGSHPKIDWKIAEFFIIGKQQKQGCWARGCS